MSRNIQSFINLVNNKITYEHVFGILSDFGSELLYNTATMMKMNEQITSIQQSEILQNISPPNIPTTSLTTVKALLLKTLTLQSRNWCSNLCQIITPVLCLLFTLAVRQIVGGITTGAVWSLEYPQPINQPIVQSLIRPQLGLACQQLYFYQHSASSQRGADKLASMQMKQVCPDGGLSPKFKKVSSVNAEVMQCIQKADALNFQRGDDLKTDIPDGIVKFKQVTNKTLNVSVGINDFRLPEYHKNNGVTKILIKTSNTTTISTYLRVTEGLLSFIQRITRPYLMYTNPKQVISGSFMYMPFQGQDKSFINKMVNVIGSGLYPLGLSLLLPLLLYLLVSEKQERQLEIMKMNGLQMKSYWINFFIVSFGMSMACSTIMFIIGRYIIEITFFINTSSVLLYLIFIGWAIAQVSMAALFQIFIDSAKTATIVGYVLSIFSTLIGVTICTVIFPYPMTMPTFIVLYPPFALSRIVFHLGLACADSRECYSSIFDADPELIFCLFVLFGWFLMYLLAMWLNQMVQQEYGVARRPALIEKIIKWIKRPKNNALLQEQQLAGQGRSDVNGIQLAEMQSLTVSRGEATIDASVKKHAEQVMETRFQSEKLPLVIYGLSKQYLTDNGQKGRIALKPLTLSLQKGEIFGFLGPNGAGKTTLISVLTGMYPQSSGTAFISGLPIGTSSTNKCIGVCPQFDILWGELTIEEHLYFYSRLKGVPEQGVERKTRESLQEVDLYNNRTMKAKELSGGMQRRLSIAIALVGSPSVIFLDQPSSGLDPFHRRQIWDILLRCKRKIAIFLTSHMMDEVQFLCDRIGIISQGQLRCVGGIHQLKERFGKGYKLVVSFPNVLREGGARPEVVRKLIQEWGLQVVGELQTRVVMRIGKEEIPKCVALLREETDIVWSIDQPSLYDVFTHFVK